MLRWKHLNRTNSANRNDKINAEIGHSLEIHHIGQPREGREEGKSVCAECELVLKHNEREEVSQREEPCLPNYKKVMENH